MRWTNCTALYEHKSQPLQIPSTKLSTLVGIRYLQTSSITELSLVLLLSAPPHTTSSASTFDVVVLMDICFSFCLLALRFRRDSVSSSSSSARLPSLCSNESPPGRQSASRRRAKRRNGDDQAENYFYLSRALAGLLQQQAQAEEAPIFIRSGHRFRFDVCVTHCDDEGKLCGSKLGNTSDPGDVLHGSESEIATER